MICINLIRVSADSKYLDINVETSLGYVLDTLQIDRYDGFSWDSGKDFSSFLTKEIKVDKDGNTIWKTDEDGDFILENGFKIPETINKKKQVLRINLEEVFGGSGMFKITMTQKWIGEKGQEPQNEICNKTSVAYASDVAMVYKYLVGKLMNMNCACYKLDEDLERNFTFLYAHQESMQLGRISEAEAFYSALAKTFNLCGPKGRFGNNCVCQTKPTQQPSRPNYISKQTPGCNCRR